MNIYINNEEVLCNSNLLIKKSLGNTSSTILNNVYPKSWESDKDYVSRYYMPKDYSPCKIIDNNVAENKEVVKYMVYSNKGIYNNIIETTSGGLYGQIVFCAVEPGMEYEVDMYSYLQTYVYEADDYIAGTEVTELAPVGLRNQNVRVTPTKKYLILQTKNTRYTLIDIYNFYIVGKVRNVDFKDNNVHIIKNLLLRYSDNKLIYNTDNDTGYIKVIPGKPYTIYASSVGGARFICETDSLNVGTTTTRLVEVRYASNCVYSFTPTKNYIVFSTGITISNFYYTYDTTKIFNGYIKNSGNINLNPRYPHYSTLQLLDYENLLSEGDMLSFVLERQNVTSAIKRIVRDLDGFMIGTLEINDSEIAPYNCNEKTPKDVFDYLAEVTGSIWYTITIDENVTLINFRAIDNLVQASNIEYTNKYFKDNEILDIKYSYNTKDYRNKQVVTSNGVLANITQVENITYNGSAIETTYPVGSVYSIKRGSKNFSVASNIAEKNGTYANFYYTYGSRSIEVNTTLVHYGDMLRVEYYPIINSRQVAYNQEEDNRIKGQTLRSGTISRYEKRTDTTSELELSQIAQTYLDIKGVPEITLEIKSTKDIFEGYGERVFFSGPLEDLQTNYLIIEKNIDMYVTGNEQQVFYTYKLSSSFNNENAINYFDNQRRKMAGTISEGEYISRYVDLPSTTNIIFYGYNGSEIAIPNDTLEAELDVELSGSIAVPGDILDAELDEELSDKITGNKLNSKLDFKI